MSRTENVQRRNVAPAGRCITTASGWRPPKKNSALPHRACLRRQPGKQHNQQQNRQQNPQQNRQQSQPMKRVEPARPDRQELVQQEHQEQPSKQQQQQRLLTPHPNQQRKQNQQLK